MFKTCSRFKELNSNLAQYYKFEINIKISMRTLPSTLSILHLSIAANIFGLLWLTVSILVLGLLLVGTLSKKMAGRLPVHRVRRLMLLLTLAIIPTVLLRLFVFEVFNIPSSSMESKRRPVYIVKESSVNSPQSSVGSKQ